MDDAIERWLVQIRKGVVELLVLSRLAHAPAHGYAIATALRETAGMGVSEGTLYPLLARLKKQGWIEAEWMTDGGGAARKTYTITPGGRAHLRLMREQWQRIDALIQDFGDKDG